MKNLSCFKCYYHKCIDHNICIREKECELKEGEFYHDRLHIRKRRKINHVRTSVKKLKIKGKIDHKFLKKTMSFSECLVFIN